MKLEIRDSESGTVTFFKGDREFEQKFVIKSSVNKMKRYLIDAKWWAKWCDYCNFDQNEIMLDQLNNMGSGFSRMDDLAQDSMNYMSSASNRKHESI